MIIDKLLLCFVVAIIVSGYIGYVVGKIINKEEVEQLQKENKMLKEKLR